jgi:hypothetical protein
VLPSRGRAIHLTISQRSCEGARQGGRAMHLTPIHLSEVVRQSSRPLTNSQMNSSTPIHRGQRSCYSSVRGRPRGRAIHLDY